MIPKGKQGLRYSQKYAGFHTFSPSADIMQYWLTENEDRLFYYFDCSQAEVKTCAYASKDPTILKMYDEGKDIYIEMGKAFYKDKFQPHHRKMFKSIVLGLLYGRGVKSVSDAAEIPIEEAKKAIDMFKNMFPVMFEYIQRKVDYAYAHGEIETLLGNKIYLRPQDTPSTCGINYFVQGGSALMLCEGFYNCAYKSIINKLGVLSKGTIHDAYFGTLWARLVVFMYFYFSKNFTQYLEVNYGIRFLYDFELGTDFRNKVHCTLNTDTAIMNLKGNAKYAKSVAERILRCNKETITEKTVQYIKKGEIRCETTLSDMMQYAEEHKKCAMSGLVDRRNHFFGFEDNWYVYPDAEIQLQVDKEYMLHCKECVDTGNVAEFAQEW